MLQKGSVAALCLCGWPGAKVFVRCLNFPKVFELSGSRAWYSGERRANIYGANVIGAHVYGANIHLRGCFKSPLEIELDLLHPRIIGLSGVSICQLFFKLTNLARCQKIV